MKPQRQRTQRVCVNNIVMFLRLTSRNQRNNYSLMSLLLIFLLNSQVFARTTIANTCCSIFSQLAMSYLKILSKDFIYLFVFFLNICVGTCVSLYAPSACRCPKMPEGDGSSGTGVPGSCEVPEVASGNWTLLLGKSSFSHLTSELSSQSLLRVFYDNFSNVSSCIGIIPCRQQLFWLCFHNNNT